MINNKAIVILALGMMLVSGCTGVIDEPIDVPDVTLPSDWSTSISRTVTIHNSAVLTTVKNWIAALNNPLRKNIEHKFCNQQKKCTIMVDLKWMTE